VAAFGFAVAVIALVRPLAFRFVFRKAIPNGVARLFMGWFGPRGLSSLLLALLAVQAAIPQAEYLLAIIGVVVLVSVVAHGITATPVSTWYGNVAEQPKRDRVLVSQE
ncbi:MAG: cation:proton antiporter, partial [Chloroflexales bacterium]|nr:cation:proton antiporter [Chloroflexales bacterium]